MFVRIRRESFQLVLAQPPIASSLLLNCWRFGSLDLSSPLLPRQLVFSEACKPPLFTQHKRLMHELTHSLDFFSISNPWSISWEICTFDVEGRPPNPCRSGVVGHVARLVHSQVVG